MFFMNKTLMFVQECGGYMPPISHHTVCHIGKCPCGETIGGIYGSSQSERYSYRIALWTEHATCCGSGSETW